MLNEDFKNIMQQKLKFWKTKYCQKRKGTWEYISPYVVNAVLKACANLQLQQSTVHHRPWVFTLRNVIHWNYSYLWYKKQLIRKSNLSEKTPNLRRLQGIIISKAKQAGSLSQLQSAETPGTQQVPYCPPHSNKQDLSMVQVFLTQGPWEEKMGLDGGYAEGGLYHRRGPHLKSLVLCVASSSEQVNVLPRGLRSFMVVTRVYLTYVCA
jgi:hypothetical protein